MPLIRDMTRVGMQRGSARHVPYINNMR
jgi:hypothetical protein